MHHDLDLAQKTAAATPGDWVLDFSFVGGYQLHTCGNCLKLFHSFAARPLCFLCRNTDPAITPEKPHA